MYAQLLAFFLLPISINKRSSFIQLLSLFVIKYYTWYFYYSGFSVGTELRECFVDEDIDIYIERLING